MISLKGSIYNDNGERFRKCRERIDNDTWWNIDDELMAKVLSIDILTTIIFKEGKNRINERLKTNDLA